ncbi:hypothetical protein BDZ97DRAFT_1757040 [Flammula alnicola]|nr:hypothetical protein BDZ97DRAFT_1757040 [Flammula alnicola]
MTRSAKGISRREAFTKSVRAKAHSEGILFKNALHTVKTSVDARAIDLHQEVRRNPGRSHDGPMGGWNSSEFVSPAQVDDGALSVNDEDVYDFKVDFDSSPEAEFRHHTDMSVSILDIARPAKGKGVAKDFQVVRNMRNVVVLPEEEFEIWEDDVFERSLWDDDWEQIYDEQRVDTRPSYSSVLRGNDR